MSGQEQFPRQAPGTEPDSWNRFKQIEEDIAEIKLSAKEDRDKLWAAIEKTNSRLSSAERWINIAIGFCSAVSLIAGWLWSKLTGDK